MSRAVQQEQAGARPLRADARRNRDLLLETAAEVFEERGVDAPLEEIARRAGVGIGTLYRHYPTRDAVVEAVYRREVEILCSGVQALLAEHDPVTALRTWMRSFAVYVARKRGMATALKAMVGIDSELFRESHERIESAITVLVRTAAATGAIRTDIEPMDLLRGMSGICMAGDMPGSTERTARLVDLLIDGMRYGAST
jgi:AcrR family transcriptional regulator